MAPLYAGIEAGGTKFVCAVASGPDDVRATVQFPTTSPEETIGRAMSFFREQDLSLIHISEPTRLLSTSYAFFCFKKKKNKTKNMFHLHTH